MSPDTLVRSILRALSRARTGILTIAITYFVSVLVGAAMVHTGNEFALGYGDDLVAKARASNPASIALAQGDRLSAAVSDFAQNLFLGAVPSTLGGLGVVIPYPFAALRGWVGGIVSVDRKHASRLADPAEAFYYLLTLVLQLIPYSLAGGAGVNLGLAYYRPRPVYQGDKWLGLPKEAIADVLRIYALVVPLFFIASLWEFLAR